MGPRSPEGRVANQIINALDSFSFKENVLAYMLSNGNNHVQKRMFNLLMHMVRIWAARYETGNYSDDTLDMHVNAKRIQETLERYGYVFTPND